VTCADAAHHRQGYTTPSPRYLVQVPVTAFGSPKMALDS
jgi:hypothetical protein